MKVLRIEKIGDQGRKEWLQGSTTNFYWLKSCSFR